ncbi:hypothetical protein [Burkholderia ubonensis]|uniref:hypothetical protein n=1 Tax=Burkholderia ubonensis TaxID=101571 RepID=UPI000759DC7C|nr:hypothetical protein [Burkholderia ubonensis]KWK63880.1 hypothetical protein WM15_12150 [Burkholderia ubonensis]
MNEMLFREIDRRAGDFLVAVDSTMRTDRALPPARAARAGLIPAWRAWVDALRRRDLVFIPIAVKPTPRPDQCDLPIIVQLIFTDERDPLMAHVPVLRRGKAGWRPRT